MTKIEFRRSLQDLLAPDSGSLHDSDTRDTVEQWSSLADVQILALISGTFGMEPDHALLNYETVGELLSLLEGRQAFE
jgi:acyl carrier protein